MWVLIALLETMTPSGVSISLTQASLVAHSVRRILRKAASVCNANHRCGDFSHYAMIICLGLHLVAMP